MIISTSTVRSEPSVPRQGVLSRWVRRRGIAESDQPSGGSIVERLLQARGLANDDAIHTFLHPSLQSMHDPALLPNVISAAQRIELALRNGEHIVIYGDYDVDGITATTILYKTFLCALPEATKHLHWYIPHRVNEGYGLNTEAIEQLASEGVRLIITVDCGVTAVEPAARARALGVDLIITDHHHPPPADDSRAWPDTPWIVHPRAPGSKYPFADLCGAGVAYKLAIALARVWCGSERVSASLRNVLVEMLAFVALGTIADVVPLRDENRIFTRFGLKQMRCTSNLGLNALIHASALEDESRISCDAVGFRLAPRLNAAGRMGHARSALELFTTSDPAEARQLAGELDRQNRERQTTERAIFAQASEMALQQGMTHEAGRIIVLAHPDWHPGVVGIVCARLVELYHRPAILMQDHDGLMHGSCRSIEGYSIHEALTTVADLLESFGGHDMAAGLSLASDKYAALVARLSEHARQHIEVEDMTKYTVYDLPAMLSDFPLETVKQVEALGPFGRDNPSPAFLLEGLCIVQQPMMMGREGKHLSLQVSHGPPAAANDAAGGSWSNRAVMRMVMWDHGHLAANTLVSGMHIHAIVRPQINTWSGHEKVEAQILDLAIAPPA